MTANSVIRPSLLLFVPVLFAASISPSGGDWPDWRGPNRDGVSHEKNLPEKWSLAGQNLAAALTDLTPKFIGFALSFWIAGNFWIFYHNVYRYIRRYDRNLIMLNLLFLMFIVLIPFPSDLLSRFTSEPSALLIYSVMMGCTGATLAAIWRYASSKRRLIDDDLSDDAINRLRLRTYISPALFVVSIPVTYVYAPATPIVWVMTIPVVAILERLHRK